MPDTLTEQPTQFTDNIAWRQAELTDRLRARLGDDSNVSASLIDWTNPQYPAAAVAAFDFVRAHGRGRYSDRTLMSLRRAADRWNDAAPNENRLSVQESMHWPQFIIAETPFNYDPDTEVKMGGVLGVAALLPGEEQTRGVIVVHRDRTRQGIGTFLYRELFRRGDEAVRLYVGRTNRAGLMFALSVGCEILGMNATTGAIELGGHVASDEMVPSYEDGYDSFTAGHARHGRPQPINVIPPDTDEPDWYDDE